MLKIDEAVTKEDLNEIGRLFEEYAALLREREGISNQGVFEELPLLPAGYVSPGGRLLIARFGAEIAGCGALHKLDERHCEIRHVYIRPQFRGKGIGRAVTLTLLDAARLIGYSFARLSTTPVLVEAIRLYESLGFKRIEPYCEDPYPCPIFMELEL